MSSDEVWTDPPRGTDPSNCVMCGTPTKSHAIPVNDIPDEQAFEHTTTAEDADFLFPVCHTCYRDIDGDPDVVVEHLTTDRSSMLDEAGLTPQRIASMQNADTLIPSERVKAFGANARELVDAAEDGTVFQINDDTEWVVLEAVPGTHEDAPQVLCSVVERAPRGDPAVGAITESAHPYRDNLYLGYVDEDDQETMDYIEIESIERLGSTPEPHNYD